MANHCSGGEDFRKLLLYVADWLDEDAVDQLGFLSAVPKEKRKSGVGLLEELVKRGKFSSTHTQPLIELLEAINKCQVAQYVRDNYHPGHKPIERTTSLPTKPSPNLANGRRTQRSNTEHNIQIIVSEHSSEEDKEQPTPQDSDRHLSVAPGDYNTHASYYPRIPEPQDNENTFPMPRENDGNEIATRGSDSDRSRSWTETEPLKNEIMTKKVKRCASANPVFNITFHLSPPHSPARSGSFESIHEKTAESNLPPTDSYANNTTFPSQSPSNLSFLPELSADSYVGNAASAEKEENTGLVMIPSPNNEEGVPATIHLLTTAHLSTQSTPAIQKDDSFWRWKSKLKTCARSMQYTWSIKREQLLNDIWHHRDLHCIKFPELIPIDIECGPHNPHLSLFVYPFGLFEDKNKSMTLMVKVTVPDKCPPIPSKEALELMWGVSIAANEEQKTLENSKKPVKIKFKVGVKYIYKLLSHKALQINNCEGLELRVHVSTNYSVHSTYKEKTESTVY